MKLPFNQVLAPMLKPHLGQTRLFCHHPTFCMSILYTYSYGVLGFLISANHLRKHLGELPPSCSSDTAVRDDSNFMLLHDLKIIATSMGLVQYACLLVGCFTLNHVGTEHSDGIKIKLRALLVALLGVSMSACAFASQPVELELDDDDVAQKLNNVSFARRITKPTIRLVMGYGKLSAFVTATTSLLLLVAVMSKQSWWRRGARWLAAPALLVAALETASDASDAMLAAVLRGSAEPARVAIQTAAAALLITVEILVWYFIAKFFEYNPPATAEEREKENLMRAMPQ
ncbi:uncharacterized protein LOC118264190 [Spodoptera frugiperda]|uniref:Uncharacterized protein LOC118264190 n=1 Tax=Spodoptera frugiperda TaxID=7108 RepID=A0A9R0F362_SPOFR|nr:uncharacterized protein LOC118264190 [Spodoptera frugiperda]